MSWKDLVIAKVKEFEGSIPHMYLDSVGLVTVGVGSLLRTPEAAEALPFINGDSGAPAQREEIRAEWTHVSNQEQNNYRASYYKQFTNLVLPDAAINAQVEHHLDEFAAGLAKEIPDFDSYPDAARQGILDLAFNLGVRGVIRKFPSFTAAFKARDWARCKAECNRPQVSAARNNHVKGLFDSLS